MPHDDASAILRRLNDDLDQARKEFLAIQKHVDEIVRDSPSGLPFPDGLQRTINAGRAARHAFQEYERRVANLRNFLQHGIIPPKSGETE